MRIDTSNTVQVSTNTTADGTMSLDQDGMAHLISVLTNLYSDKSLAVLREYSTNARDSHVQANNPAPIEVTLPSPLNPTLVISDHGVGLSKAELLGIYSRYGASTKRDTNTQVGSFGLGSKSAFTIGGQFIVTARKDHRQVSAVFSMNEHGVGTVTILAEHTTDEGNGVTVSIATADPAAMQQAAAKFFKAWQPGTVLLDGEAPESYYTDPDALWISPDILYTRKGGITVVMGSVAYPLPASAVYAVRSRTGLHFPTYGEASPGLLVTLPIGSVDITPSREGIRDTERSLQAISTALRPLPEQLRARLQEIRATSADTITNLFAARSLLAAAEHLSIPVSAALPTKIQLPPGTATLYGTTSRGGLRIDDLDNINPETAHLITVLVGVPAKRSAKRHAKAWLEEHSNRKMLISFQDSEATAASYDWFRYGTDSPVSTVHFDDIELPASQRTASDRQPTTYGTTLPDGTHTQLTAAELKSETLPIAYSSGYSGTGRVEGYLTVTLTSRQSEEVFLRRVPQAVSAHALIQAQNAAKIKAAGGLAELQRGYYLSRTVSSVSRALPGRAREITHPAYAQAVSAAAKFDALPSDVQRLVHAAQSSRATEDTATAPLYAALPLLMFVADTYHTPSPAAAKQLLAYVNAAQKETV